MTAESRPPGRAVLRLAGVLTQLIGATCLLLGTIAFVLVQQNASSGAPYVAAWCVAALVGLVFGGLMARGGLISVLASAVLDAGFGIVLLALDHAVLRGLVRVLPASDVDMIANILVGFGGAMVASAILCVVAIPQALRYGRWLQGDREQLSEPRHMAPVELPLAGSTARGWAPPTTKLSVWAMPAASRAETRSRRRLYIALAGFAIGLGGGIGILVSSTASRGAKPAVFAPGTGSGSAALTAPQPGSGSAIATTAIEVTPIGDGGSEDIQLPAVSVRELVDAQRAAIAKADFAAVAATLSPDAFGFGVDADEVAEGRDSVAAQLQRDLGESPTEGFTVESKFLAIGEAHHHAWIAMELAVSVAGQGERRFAITQLAAVIDGKWTIVAWHWAIPVADAVAERHAILGTLPAAKPVASLTTGPKDLEAAVRAAFGSRIAFAAARSERDDGFNFGSALGERVVGGVAIKKLFGRLKAEFRIHDGVRIVAADAWDPTQRGAPTIAFAAANVDFTAKTRAATDLTQTFRVLAVLVKEGTDWKIVQTQWSHGGPIR
ncbi:MAG: nuclear transport factor 2 family protein [Myxococcota bacterium]|nr:nuclear transport factor 2 family protein [Myxococcota bacterium]